MAAHHIHVYCLEKATLLNQTSQHVDAILTKKVFKIKFHQNSFVIVIAVFPFNAKKYEFAKTVRWVLVTFFDLLKFCN